MATNSALRRLPLAVTALCLVQFMDVLGVTVVVTALPSMLASLHASQAYSTLVAAAYAMFFGGLLMLGARLGDRYGHRRTILASLAVFAAGSAVTAAATSVAILTAGRFLQGAAAASSVPSALRLLTTITLAGPARRRAIAAWSAAGAAAGASGFVVGGIVTDLISWRAVFWGYLPLAAALGTVIALSVERDDGNEPAMSLNLAGSAAFTASVMLFVIGSTIITQPGGSLAGGLVLAACAVLAAAFAVIDRRAAAPLLPRPLLGSGKLRAIDLIPFSLAVIAGSALSAVALRRQRPPLVVAEGLAVIALADGALIWSPASAWAVPLCAAAAGAGIGLSSVAATGLGTDVGPRWRGGASGIVNTAAQLGTAVGVAVLLLIAAATSGVPAAGTAPPRVAWAVGAVVAAAGAARFAMPDRADRAASR